MSTRCEINIDFFRLAREHNGKWVALDPESHDVIASGDSAREVLESAERAGIAQPFITRVVDNYGAHVPWLTA